jgi:tRNA nucleotidyltransferase (CCA-adding enzyme)
MTNDDYLRWLLNQEELSQQQVASLQALRAQIEGQLRTLRGNPRFYYGGSYAKQTMIRSSFDLDIVAYWPHDCGYTLKDICYAVGDVLKRSWSAVNPKTVAWELPFQGGFHIDVVPGRWTAHTDMRTFIGETGIRRCRPASRFTSTRSATVVGAT